MSRPLALVVSALFIAGTAPPATAAPIAYVASLSGPAEFPPVASPGTGFSVVTFDPVAHTLRVQITFSGLVGTTTVAHIHAPTAIPFFGTMGVAVTPGTFPGFPVGVTAGTYDNTFNTLNPAIYTAPFFALGGGTAAGAEALLANSLATGRAYVNVHSTFAPGGEIRGFLIPAPEPATWAVFGLMAACGFAARRRVLRST